MNQRDISIDILKFIAVFLIINSHMDALYPKYKMLATGGAIGDVLFLFASGYTLFLSNRKLRFDNWYKRRINRIYPSVIVCAIIGTLFSEKQYITLLSMGGGGICHSHNVLLYIIVFHKRVLHQIYPSTIATNCFYFRNSLLFLVSIQV